MYDFYIDNLLHIENTQWIVATTNRFYHSLKNVSYEQLEVVDYFYFSTILNLSLLNSVGISFQM